MRVESARDLKRAVLSLAAVGDFETRNVSVGIAPGDNFEDYKLAIRLFRPTHADQVIAQRITMWACGEANVRELGAVSSTIDYSGLRSAYQRRVLTVGSSVSHYSGSAGSLGCFARRTRDGRVGMISCNHVIAAEDRGCEGDEVLFPAPHDGGRRPENVVAYLDGAYVPLKRRRVESDCAFALLGDTIPFEPRQLGPSETLKCEVADPFEVGIVEKIGRTTSRTKGRISAFDLDPLINYSFGSIRMAGQLEVEPVNDTPFSLPGDSGAVIFDGGLYPVALITAASVLGGPTNLGLAYATPLDRVLTLLGIELLES